MAVWDSPPLWIIPFFFSHFLTILLCAAETGVPTGTSTVEINGSKPGWKGYRICERSKRLNL